MELKQMSKKEILQTIIAEGGKSFLDALCISKVRHRTEKQKCPTCGKRVGAKGRAWMLTNVSGTPVFGDRYDSDDCAALIEKCLYQILAAYKAYPGPKKCDEDLAEDELRDPLPMKDDETLKQYGQRLQKHLEHLAQITPEIEEDARIEDHL